MNVVTRNIGKHLKSNKKWIKYDRNETIIQLTSIFIVLLKEIK